MSIQEYLYFKLCEGWSSLVQSFISYKSSINLIDCLWKWWLATVVIARNFSSWSFGPNLFWTVAFGHKRHKNKGLNAYRLSLCYLMIKLTTSVTLLAEKQYEGMKIWILNFKSSFESRVSSNAIFWQNQRSCHDLPGLPLSFPFFTFDSPHGQRKK